MKPLAYFEARPWERGLQPETVFPNLEGISGKHDGAFSIQKAALCRARIINADYNIYTDGSASAGTTDGGADVVITTADPDSPVISALRQCVKPSQPLWSGRLQTAGIKPYWRSSGVTIPPPSKHIATGLASRTPHYVRNSNKKPRTWSNGSNGA